MTTAFHTRYLPTRAAGGARLRLFCFHHAGGAASAFAGWRTVLAPGVDVLPVQLPGREARIREPRHTDLGELAAELAGELRPALDAGPHAFYGHSMGALVAYHLAQLRSAAGTPPTALLVGAYPAPHLPTALAYALDLRDGELTELMISIGGLSPELTAYPRWLRAALDLLRDDLRLCHSRPAGASHASGASGASTASSVGTVRGATTAGGAGAASDVGRPLPCPIEVFLGAADPIVAPYDAAGWGRHTTAGTRTHVLPGGHFFPRDNRSEFLDRLGGVLAGVPVPR